MTARWPAKQVTRVLHDRRVPVNASFLDPIPILSASASDECACAALSCQSLVPHEQRSGTLDDDSEERRRDVHVRVDC